MTIGPIPQGRIRQIISDGELVWALQCPQCGCWGQIDRDQLHGRVSVDHTDCKGPGPRMMEFISIPAHSMKHATGSRLRYGWSDDHTKVASGPYRRAKRRDERAVGMIPCPECDREFPTNTGLGVHRRRVHSVRSLHRRAPVPVDTSTPACPECAAQFATPHGLAVHRSHKHSAKRVRNLAAENERRRLRRQMNPARFYEYTKTHERLNPEKTRARRALQRAAREGRVTRPDVCSACGCSCAPEGHHPDYAKPLEVMWLCRPCHRVEDRKGVST